MASLFVEDRNLEYYLASARSVTRNHRVRLIVLKVAIRRELGYWLGRRCVRLLRVLARVAFATQRKMTT